MVRLRRIRSNVDSSLCVGSTRVLKDCEDANRVSTRVDNVDLLLVVVDKMEVLCRFDNILGVRRVVVFRILEVGDDANRLTQSHTANITRNSRRIRATEERRGDGVNTLNHSIKKLFRFDDDEGVVDVLASGVARHSKLRHFITSLTSPSNRPSAKIQTIPIITRTARSTIRNLRDLIRFRNIDSTHGEAVDHYLDDVWDRLMTQESFNYAADVGFIPFITKWLDIKDKPMRGYTEVNPLGPSVEPEPRKQLSTLQPIFHAIKHDQHDFYIALINHANLHKDIGVVIGVLLGKQEFVEGLLSVGHSPRVMIVHHPENHVPPNIIRILDLAEQWFMKAFEVDEDHDEDEKEDDEIIYLQVLTTADPDFAMLHSVADVPLLHEVARSGNLPFMKSLIERGFEVKDYYDNSPSYGLLASAFHSRNIELIRFLYPLVDLHLEYGNTGNGRLRGTYDQLVEGRHGYVPETRGFNKDDCAMFVKAATTQDPGDFVKNIVLFGNVAYLPLALLILEQYKDTQIIRGIYQEDTDNLLYCYEYYLRGVANSRMGFAPLFERMKELGYTTEKGRGAFFEFTSPLPPYHSPLRQE